MLMVLITDDGVLNAVLATAAWPKTNKQADAKHRRNLP